MHARRFFFGVVGVASQLARCQTLTGVRLLVACDRVPVLCEAWELANPGKCWYVENQTGGCTRGRECQNWYDGHPEAPGK